MNVFHIDKNTSLCYRLPEQIPVFREQADHMTQALINTCKDIFSECCLPSRIVFDSQSNFCNDKFVTFHTRLNIKTYCM